jgi:hypothetical protein
MAEIVNLRRVKKQRARDEQAREAKENRIRHGRTAAQKENDARAEHRRQLAMDGKNREGA